MVSSAHVVLTDYGPEFGWGVTSPQLPELVGGRLTLRELESDLPSILVFGGLDLEGQVERHVQRYTMSGDAEVAVRVAQDAQSPARTHVAEAIQQRLGSTPDATSAWMPASTGEVTIVACVADDTVRWVLEQVDDGQPVGIAFTDGGQIKVFFVQHDEQDKAPGPSLRALGETLDSRVADVWKHSQGTPEHVPVRSLEYA